MLVSSSIYDAEVLFFCCSLKFVATAKQFLAHLCYNICCMLVWNGYATVATAEGSSVDA
jgi:hypothetical protein